MAYTTGLCERVTAEIADIWGNNAPATKYLKIGTLQALNSSINTDGFEQIQFDPAHKSKKRKVVVKRVDKMCFDVALDPYDCEDFSDNIEPEPNEQEYELPPIPYTPQTPGGAPARLKLDKEEMRLLCEDNDPFMAARILQFLRTFEQGLNKQIMLAIDPLIGTDIDGNDVTNIPVFTVPAGGVQMPMQSAKSIMQNKYLDIMASGNPIMLHGKLMSNYNASIKTACCNNWGIDVSKALDTEGGMADWFSFFDQQMDSTIGEGDFYLLSPGAIQLVQWFKYKFDKHEDDLWTTGTIVSPVTGIEYDMRIIYDYKCEAWYVELFTFMKPIVTDAGACGTTENINGTLKFHACAQPETYVCEEA